MKSGSSETTNNSCVDLAIWNGKRSVSKVVMISRNFCDISMGISFCFTSLCTCIKSISKTSFSLLRVLSCLYHPASLSPSLFLILIYYQYFLEDQKVVVQEQGPQPRNQKLELFWFLLKWWLSSWLPEKDARGHEKTLLLKKFTLCLITHLDVDSIPITRPFWHSGWWISIYCSHFHDQ